MKYTDTELLDFYINHGTDLFERSDTGRWRCKDKDGRTSIASTAREAIAAALTAHRRASITPEEKFKEALEILALDILGMGCYRRNGESWEEAIDRHILEEKEKSC